MLARSLRAARMSVIRGRRATALRAPGGCGVGAGAGFDYNRAMSLDYLISALVTLLVVVDPLGLTPTFLAVTQGLSAAARKRSRCAPASSRPRSWPAPR